MTAPHSEVSMRRSRRASPSSPATRRTSRRPSLRRLGADDALLALLIGAMNANDHVSPEEGARAHNIIWSMRRFRRKSGETVERGIEQMRALIEEQGVRQVVAAAASAVPAPLRESAFAVAADLVLADGRLEGAERRYLLALAKDLKLESRSVSNILDVMLVKNAV
jgi:tellurite resistance protein